VDLAVMLMASLLIIFKHKSNIQRLINGTENRLHFGKS
jgi:glycerol-3-phosphate acyltransferase PlsY